MPRMIHVYLWLNSGHLVATFVAFARNGSYDVCKDRLTSKTEPERGARDEIPWRI